MGIDLCTEKRFARMSSFPKQYPNNTECTWEITANNGYHVGLVFVERFNLEGGQDCGNDYIEVIRKSTSVNQLP